MKMKVHVIEAKTSEPSAGKRKEETNKLRVLYFGCERGRWVLDRDEKTSWENQTQQSHSKERPCRRFSSEIQ